MRKEYRDVKRLVQSIADEVLPGAKVSLSRRSRHPAYVIEYAGQRTERVFAHQAANKLGAIGVNARQILEAMKDGL